MLRHMFWSRLLTEAEHAFVRRFFAHSLDALQPRLRLYVRGWVTRGVRCR